MDDGNYISKSMKLDLSRSQSCFLDAELSRLRLQYGIKLTVHDYIILLIDMQRIRALAQQGDNPHESIAWLYQRITEGRLNAMLPERGGSSDDPARDDGVAKAQNRDGALLLGKGVQSPGSR